MQIETLYFVEGAKQASGTTVIIDVFRAFSLVCYLLDQGAEKIIPVGDIEKAYQIKGDHPGYILIGERNNRKMPGFDFDNSPYRIKDQDFTGKTIVHTTSAGTQGIVSVSNADVILTGSFVNAGATINYIASENPMLVSLVCMGYSAQRIIEEDSLCATYMKQKLEGLEPDFSRMVDEIRKTSGRRFFNPETQEHCPKEDFDLCLRLDAFNFVVKAVKDEKLGMILTKAVL